MLSLDPALRARMLNSGSSTTGQKQKTPTSKSVSLKGRWRYLSPAPYRFVKNFSCIKHEIVNLFLVMFELPEFTIELLGDLGCPVESGLVSISFRDFILNYDQTSAFVNHLQVSNFLNFKFYLKK